MQILDVFKQIAKEESIGNVTSGTIIRRNPDDTYDVQFNSGSIKKRVRNISNRDFTPNTSVTMLLPSGKKSNVRIIGLGMASRKPTKIVDI